MDASRRIECWTDVLKFVQAESPQVSSPDCSLIVRNSSAYSSLAFPNRVTGLDSDILLDGDLYVDLHNSHGHTRESADSRENTRIANTSHRGLTSQPGGSLSAAIPIQRCSDSNGKDVSTFSLQVCLGQSRQLSSALVTFSKRMRVVDHHVLCKSPGYFMHFIGLDW